MLDEEEREFLRQELTSTAHKSGALVGMTYAEIAGVLNVDRDPSDEVTADSVRHYVRQLRKDSRAAVEIPAKQGWPKGRARSAAQRRPRKTFPASLFGELLALTGLNSATLYDLLHRISRSEGWLPPKRTFYSHIARSEWIPARSSERKQAARSVIEQCRVRLHQIAFQLDGCPRYWVAIAAYEETTQYLNLAVFDVEIDSDAARRPGRPKKLDANLPLAVIHRDGVETRIELPLVIWERFIVNTIDRLGLPVSKFVLVSDPGIAPGSLRHRHFECSILTAYSRLKLSPIYSIPNALFDKIKRSLPVAVNEHNQCCYETLRSCRANLIALFDAARAAGRPDFKVIPLSLDVRERIDILDYYDGMNRPVQRQLRNQLYRPLLLRGTVDE